MPGRTLGCGHIMTSVAFKKGAKSHIAFVDIRMNAQQYQDILEEHLVPFITITADDGVIFQQDVAPIPTPASTGRLWN